MTAVGTDLAANPLSVGMARTVAPEPCAFVIFGASGDLTSRKLLPALYALWHDMLLPARFAVVGVSRGDMDDAAFREKARAAVAEFGRVKPDGESWRAFSECLTYVGGDIGDAQTFERLREHLKKADTERGTAGNRVYYLAVPPSVFPPLIKKLGDAGMVEHAERPYTRVVIEKPFGHDLRSAKALNEELKQTLVEDQVFRMDHYLGKETVQNLFVFRFANSLFEPVWNRNLIDHVQITVAEPIGVEGRGAFYEESGILRDIVQNHMMQLLSLVGMEPPGRFTANEVRDEKVKLLRSVHIPMAEDVERIAVRGQYGPGAIAGKEVVGYRQEPGVAPDSVIETYAALRLEIDNWRWAGVPFFLRAGKRLPKRVTEIAVQFRAVPHLPFAERAARAEPCVLVLRIQPDEGISLRFAAKVPGFRIAVQSVKMDFRYGTSFGVEPPEAYERLILDCLLGDSTLFARADEVEAAWTLMDPILAWWGAHRPGDFPNYEAGTWGPAAAARVFRGENRAWRRP
ncbi:MAG TPA: glucose-6-phosphate dehydrogenase [Candidatus Eisenbacteria bacterium]|jgi:glucose-6-phosphate 1-dehydrogenase|nr:glucose-6-phosphate dehydrogenase [Candidatus Eisenbacteria bacterium]